MKKNCKNCWLCFTQNEIMLYYNANFLFSGTQNLNPRGFWGIRNTKISKSTTRYDKYLNLHKDKSRFSPCFILLYFLNHSRNISKSPVDDEIYLHSYRHPHTENKISQTKSLNHSPLRRYRKKKEKFPVWFLVL